MYRQLFKNAMHFFFRRALSLICFFQQAIPQMQRDLRQYQRC